MTPGDPLSLAARLGATLDRLEISYVIGGSVCSSIWGEPRATIDLNLMIDASERDVHLLAEELKPDFYIDESSAVEAVRRESSFNAVHYDSSMKVDFFIAENRPLVVTQMERRHSIIVGEQSLSIYAPEDLLIRKLMWFRLGGETSERQWRDVLGILRVSGTNIDEAYTRSAAEEAEVSDLLERALRET